MKKALTILILVAILAGTFVPVQVALAGEHLIESTPRGPLIVGDVDGGIDDETDAESGDINSGECGKSPSKWGNCLLGALAWILMWAVRLLGLIVSATAAIFEFALDLSIFKFAKLADSGSTVMAAWQVVRDVANIFFIFIILYVAIGIILKLQSFDTRKFLVTLIIVALLINFSAVFAKVVIDASNIMALQFYEAAKGKHGSITNAFMVSIKPQSFFGSNTITVGFQKGVSDPDNPEAGAPKLTLEPVVGSDGKILYGDKLTLSNVLLDFILIILVMLILIFILLAASVLFILRTVFLLFLIALAPLAFLAMILPKAGADSGISQWWNHLFKQAFFAPAFLFLFYISMVILDNQKFGVADDAELAGKLVHFTLVAGFMIMALVLSQKMGAWGSGAVMSTGKKLRGTAKNMIGGGGALLARQTMGRFAAAIANRPGLREASKDSGFKGFMARQTVKRLDTVADARFGAKKGYIGKIKERAEDHEKFGQRIMEDTRTGVKIVTPVGEKSLKEQYADTLTKAGAGKVIGRAAAERAKEKLGKEVGREKAKEEIREIREGRMKELREGRMKELWRRSGC